MVLNSSQQTLTNSSLLCHDRTPSYYGGIPVQGTISAVVESNKYCRHSPHSLTLEQVPGQGLCVGEIPAAKDFLCNSKYPLTTVLQNSVYPLTASTVEYPTPPKKNDIGWACFSGLIPCAYTTVLKNSKGYHVLISLVPRLIYLDYQDFLNRMEQEARLPRIRKPLNTFILSILLVELGTATASHLSLFR